MIYLSNAIHIGCFYRIALINEKIDMLRKKGAEPQEINRLVKTLKEANNQLKKAEYDTIYGDKKYRNISNLF